eukprot:CAMPEP_0185699198 /NCGR_PEP_ID=MMETSP1164-20130828/6782_1 /TAXON_ID=1104430 /ORGANISM="Chrysoreinhardia sp, Strain CCMP2950" /LENGTH=311 /DNA_ID=CAMNT_0028366131 /DNA_START=148 /DNA_END=1079 /DNA_ORIENTATION=+
MSFSQQQWEEARQSMGAMDPEQFKMQAAMLKGYPKPTIRQLVPQFASMTDAQIDGALAQMEMMADNPSMMAMARNQMQNMTHAQAAAQMEQAKHHFGAAGAAAPGAAVRAFALGDRVALKNLAKAPEHNGKLGSIVGFQGERYKVLLDAGAKTLALKAANLEKVADHPAGGDDPADDDDDDDDAVLAGDGSSEPTVESIPKVTTTSGQQRQHHHPEPVARAAPGGATNIEAEQLRQAVENPEMLRQQAAAMKTMSPDTVRRLNPQMAHFTDAQIQFAATQMEMMANNPAMLKMAQQQMANMSPEQIAQMRG